MGNQYVWANMFVSLVRCLGQLIARFVCVCVFFQAMAVTRKENHLYDISAKQATDVIKGESARANRLVYLKTDFGQNIISFLDPLLVR